MSNVFETYSTMYDNSHNRIANRVMLGINWEEISKDGEIGSCTFADVLLCESPMITFIVDEGFYQQIHKFIIKIIEGKYRLVLKDGEEYISPVHQETEKEKQIRLLKEQLAKLETGGGMFDE